MLSYDSKICRLSSLETLGKRGSTTTRWSGRARDFGEDAEVICRRSAMPLLNLIWY